MPVTGTTKVVDNGPDDEKWCLVIAGDGFTSAEMGAFATVVDDFVVFLEANLTGVVNWDKVNVIRMDVESNESGADHPGCDTSIEVDTYFDAQFCIAGLDRTLEINESIAIDAANINFPEWDALLVFVNITEYGGLGRGGVAVASLDPVWSHEIALHEMGHAAFDLADEYDSWAGCNSGETTQNTYPVATEGEPVEENVTATLSPLKWDDIVDPATPIPTTSNPDCTQCDTQASPVAPGTVGAFAGGRYYHCGIWRPEYDCRMNNLGVGWCSVCSLRIGQVLTWGSLLDLTPCFIAGAVYGDPRHPDVVALRHWRDAHLRPDARGRVAMRAANALYGLIGPPLATHVRHRPRLVGVLQRHVFGPLAGLVTSQREGQ